MRNFFYSLTRDSFSLLGVAITTASALTIVTLLAMEWIAAEPGGPYLGILAFLILPGIFIFGLILIPIGWMRARRRARRGVTRSGLPVIDLNTARTRTAVLVFLALTSANVIILATATYKGVEVMDSTGFCADTCHVMAPERTAYARSPHARVKCVECHIGPGADWFVKSKLSGAWQVVATNLELYPKPIPTPIENLRPARDTCEHCHWPTKFIGDRLRVITHYATDEANTELKTVVLLRIGGVEGRKSHGIHWHVDPGIEIRYRSDPSREVIYDVELRREDGAVEQFRAEAQPEAGAETEWRTMDCVDCHNRPTHVFRTPEQEIDWAIERGRIDRALPYVRREGLRLLQASYASQDEARAAVAAGLETFYRENYPDVASSAAPAIAAAGTTLGELYAYNVFPQMGVTWGTYPNHIGHQYSPGCFRCHDDAHESEAGRTISQDCATCHTLLAMEEENPAVLATLQP